jgi:hypothetical protein
LALVEHRFADALQYGVILRSVDAAAQHIAVMPLQWAMA